ncbi:MAG: hypothetical protein Ct9H300mP12_13750 [Acidimicrobiales bacterium]|nr:MAG: hypothetical protein Ct9H300mP12_13750 [Acidimicrobiales bacterium]
MLYAGAMRWLTWLGWCLGEVHFLEDPFRGAVWEEVLLHLAPSVGIVALSATVSNANEFGGFGLRLSRTDRGDRGDPASGQAPTHYLVAERGRRNTGRPLHRMSFPGQRGKNRTVQLEGSTSMETRLTEGGGVAPGFPLGEMRCWRNGNRADLLPAIHFIFSRAGCKEAGTPSSGRALS